MKKIDPYRDDISEMSDILIEEVVKRKDFISTEVGKQWLKTVVSSTLLAVMHLGFLAGKNEKDKLLN